MADLKSEVAVSLPAPPLETGFVVAVDYDDLILLDVEGSPVVFESSINTLIAEELLGCGQASLVKLDVAYVFSNSGQSIYFGVCNANASLSARAIGMRPGGYSAVSNSMTYGHKTTVTVIVPDLFSRQIQPVSSMAPAYKFSIRASKEVQVQLQLYIKRAGPRVISRSLNV